jgi:NNP family nitrate/nitrite transporter-like MFS transporter
MMQQTSRQGGGFLAMGSGLITVLALTGVFFFNFMARLILAPFVVNVELEFSLSHVQAGQLFLFASFGVSLALALSGFAAKILKHRHIVVISCLGIGLGLFLTSLAQSFAVMKVTLLGMGLAAGLYLPSGITIITSSLSSLNWGKGLAIHEMAPNCSFILAPILAAVLEGVCSWRTVFAALGLGSALMGLVFVFSNQGGESKGEAPRPSILRVIGKQPAFWILAALFGMAVSMTFGVFSMLPVYLVSSHGLDKGWANELVSISRVPSLLMAFGSGPVIDRIGAKKTVRIALSVSAALTVLLGLLSGPLIYAAVLLQPMCAVCFFPAGFTAISMSFPDHIRNVAISLIIPLALFMGTGAVPTLLGWFGDQGLFPLGFAILGLSVLIGMNLARWLPSAKAGN